MPQARSAGSSTNKPAAKRTPAKSTAAKPAATKSTAAKPAAKRAATRSTTAKTAAAKPAAAAKRPAARATGAAKSATAAKSSPAAKATTAAKAAAAKAPKPRVTIRVNAERVQVEAVAERVRKLNERIIEVGRDAGGNTLATYEKTLKAIAAGVSKNPAKDELEWIQQLAVSQAKFVKDITDSWAKSARERLK